MRSRRAGARSADGASSVFARLVVVQPDDGLMRACAQLRADSWASGHALGNKVHEADRWIAATAMVLGIELVTGDEVFRNVAGLVVAGASP